MPQESLERPPRQGGTKQGIGWQVFRQVETDTRQGQCFLHGPLLAIEEGQERRALDPQQSKQVGHPGLAAYAPSEGDDRYVIWLLRSLDLGR